MADQELISLRGIAEGQAVEVEQLLAGMRGTSGTVPWTAGLRAVVRKDDPPEED